MTKTYKKKLIEVAIPLEAINEASAREKSIRHGHPSTLHLWWARRPLAACRAVLFAQLVDDPSSNPDEFPTQEAQEAERKRLFGIIEELVKWENSTNEEILEKARAEIRKSSGGEIPSVYDPFSGGGSIPLEAQRLGLPAFGSDLNPVAVMIGKAMIQLPPKFKDMNPLHPGPKERQFYRNAEGLAEDVKFYGEWMRERAFERIGDIYPDAETPKEYGGGRSPVIGWIWSRTVPSPDPAFAEVQVPIASSFLLSSKKGKEAWIDPVVDKTRKKISFAIRVGGAKDELENAKRGTKEARGANFRCLMSDAAITADYVKKCARDGLMKRTLLAIVVSSKSGRAFAQATNEHVEVADCAKPNWRPDIALPNHSQYIGVLGYGYKTFGELFTERQLVALNTFSDLLSEVRAEIQGDAEYASAVITYLALAISRLADSCNAHCRWAADKVQLKNMFGRQAIPMTWDYFEANPFSGTAGDFLISATTVSKALERWHGNSPGEINNVDAQSANYSSNTVISTDPPYYDNIPYADLSDFFYGWMRHMLRDEYPNLFATVAVPKMEELVADRVRHSGSDNADKFFLSGMTEAISQMCRESSNNAPATIYYAFKQSEIEQEGISSTGWATFLQAILDAGYAVVGTWPMRTEMANRMRAAGSNALANSVVLVCRKKASSAEVVTRAEFIRSLKRELPAAIAELQSVNIAPADMPQSAIGPGMGVFSRYPAVLEADDSPMSVKTALQLINAELDEYLGGIQGEFDPDTRFAITWFEQYGMKAGEYGSADNLARARGISVESVKHAGIVESAAGKVRLLSREEFDEEWEPDDDEHLTVWECLQHLIRLHEKDGLSWETIRMMRMVGDKAEAAKDLAYCLYDISANKRKDAKEANAYNAIIADWTEISREAAKIHDTRRDGQAAFDL